MRDAVSFAQLEQELAIWRREWRKPVLWWRDDDARAPHPKLDRLLVARGGLPLTLAVIPDGDLRSLAARLASEDGLSISQHGVDHHNRLTPGGPRSEFPDGTAQADVNALIALGRSRLVQAGLTPAIFTPPWNEADARLLTAVRAAGFDHYSSGVGGGDQLGLGHVGAEVDVLRWKGQPHFRGRRRIFDALRLRLAARRELGRFEEPLGVLTHHLVHDEATWDFIDWFTVYARRRFEIRSLEEILVQRDRHAGIAEAVGAGPARKPNRIARAF